MLAKTATKTLTIMLDKATATRAKIQNSQNRAEKCLEGIKKAAGYCLNAL